MPVRPPSFSLPLLYTSLLALLLAACARASTLTPTNPDGSETRPPNTPTPIPPPTATPEPSPQGAAAAYLGAWARSDYAAMYALLAPESQSALPAADFEKQYRDLLGVLSAITLTAQVGEVSGGVDAARVKAHLNYNTALVGTLEADVVVEVKRSADSWGVIYSPAIIWPELVDGQKLYMAPLAPDRGAIYDRDGRPMVQAADAYAIGLVPGEVQDEGAVQSALGRLLGLPGETFLVRFPYPFAPPDQYMAIAEISAEELRDRDLEYILGLSGIQSSPYTSRYYYGHGAAAHVTGYTVFIPPDQLAAYQARGYFADQRLGATGLEKWGEAMLAGRNGGQLILLDANNQVVRRITGATQPAPAQDIYSSVDFELQQAAQFAFGDYTGAAVVLDVNTGAVLALVSSPTFDPNLFDPANRNFLFADNARISQGLLNRATQGESPAGSVFKVVTFSAGLTSGLFTPESSYECTGEWNEIGLPTPLKDWKEGGHGTLTLQEGLTGSCNPYFWHIGYALFNFDPHHLSKTARAFGLGQATGIEQLDEASGLIPDPDWLRQTEGRAWEPLDSLNLAIGQGNVLVTPLQIARMMAAIGNGGTLYQPQLVLRVQPADGGAPSYEFTPKAVGNLPLEPEQLAALQTAMFEVTRDCQGCIGTARNRFRGLPRWLKIAGKTGTAEDPGTFGLNEPDAWFAGYTYDTRSEKPDIAIAVVVQNTGQGSAFAAPIFRRIVEAYYDLPYLRYPWEASVGVVATPTPTATEGALGEATPTP